MHRVTCIPVCDTLATIPSANQATTKGYTHEGMGFPAFRLGPSQQLKCLLPLGPSTEELHKVMSKTFEEFFLK